MLLQLKKWMNTNLPCWLMFNLCYCILHIVTDCVNTLHQNLHRLMLLWRALFCLYNSASKCVWLLRRHSFCTLTVFLFENIDSVPFFHSKVELKEFRHAWSLTLIKLYSVSVKRHHSMWFFSIYFRNKDPLSSLELHRFLLSDGDVISRQQS